MFRNVEAAAPYRVKADKADSMGLLHDTDEEASEEDTDRMGGMEEDMFHGSHNGSFSFESQYSGSYICLLYTSRCV